MRLWIKTVCLLELQRDETGEAAFRAKKVKKIVAPCSGLSVHPKSDPNELKIFVNNE